MRGEKRYSDLRACPDPGDVLHVRAEDAAEGADALVVSCAETELERAARSGHAALKEGCVARSFLRTNDVDGCDRPERDDRDSTGRTEP